jgi:uncharacterized protein YfaS (alpha-2-macroglobulin family)
MATARSMQQFPAVVTMLLLLTFHAAAQSPQIAGLEDGTVALTKDRTLTISFPTAMVPASEIDVQSKASPIRLNPATPVTFMWKSQTEGIAKLGKVAPGSQLEVHVVSGLKDHTGKTVPAAMLGIATTPPFKAEISYYAETMAKRPSVSVTFNYPIRPADLAEAAWFQDRDSREHYPVEVVLPDDAGETVLETTLTPRADLPGGHTFDLLIDGISDAESGTRTSQLFIKELGKTEALNVQKIAAFNYPMQKRRIAVEFNEAVDPSEGRKITVEPAVPNLEARSVYESIWLEGDFDLEKRYRVTVPAGVLGKSGFALPAESRWEAKFHAKKPAIIFPDEDLHQRSRLGLNFSFMQVNSGPLEWKLAKVSPEKLLAIYQRVRESDEKQTDPVSGDEVKDVDTGWPKWKPTELLIEASRLETVATGSVEASELDADTLRKITWKSEKTLPAGTYLLEITGKTGAGKVIGNRALVTFTEFSAVQKLFGKTVLLRVMNIGDGNPVSGVRIRAVTEKNEFIAEGVTDVGGFATLPRAQLFPESNQKGRRAEWFLMETPDGPMLQRANAVKYEGSGYAGPVQGDDTVVKYRIAVASDRPLYRPGHTVKFKAFTREVGKGEELRIPRVKEATWQIANDESEVIASGSAKLDAYGGFDSEWSIPTTAKVGEYTISVMLPDAMGQEQINVQEFRPPPFTVALEDLKLTGAEAGIRISSAYFHGAANVGAKVKWKATWTGTRIGEPDLIVTDVPRLATVQQTRQAEASGEGVLDGKGVLELRSAPPFNDGIARGWYTIEWSVDVTAADAQTISESAQFGFYSVPVRPELKAEPVSSPSPKGPFAINIETTASGPDAKPAAGAAISVDVYRISTKTVKEQISSNIFRYRNSTSFEKLESFSGNTPFNRHTTVPATGEYLVTARDTKNAGAPVINRRVYVTGEGDAEFPVKDEETIAISHSRQNAEDDAGQAYLPGEIATLTVQAPFAGVAWVSIEAENIIDTLVMRFDGNSGLLKVPIKPEYAPNAFVSVYLLSPGGEAQLPAERFGSVELKVRRPDWELLTLPVLTNKHVRPKELVAGYIQVSSEGRPVQNADLTVYAVDESILDAGAWHEPALRESMYPSRAWQVSTHRGLERLSLGVEASTLHQKGFIIGGGEFKSVTEEEVKELRTNFPPLAFWETRLRSDKDGKVPFSFPAPDALTKYRVIALAQTKQGQFGTGSDWVEISKPVQIEPALPRFLRSGDEVELRAVVRQKTQDALPVTVRCVTNLDLDGSASETQTVQRNQPAVFRFRAKVGDRTMARIQFSTDAGPGDAVEMSLPVHPPTLLRRETVFGTFADVRSKIPKDWTSATGSSEMMISTSPWLPKLSGIPLLLEYPHGCLEQITSRVLAYTMLGDLIAYLPQPAEQSTAWRKRIEAGIEVMTSGMNEDGYLSYWPGGDSASLPTVAGFWALRNAKAQGFVVPDRLINGLAEAVHEIARGEHEPKDSAFIRAYALMALAEGGDANELGPVIREMYLRRERMEDEPRALLALAMHRLNIMPAEKKQLLREIDHPVKERAFDPETFSSTTRIDAIRALAFATINLEGVGTRSLDQLRKQIAEWLDSAQSLSTQENLWLLMAFKAMHVPAAGRTVEFRTAQPAPGAISRNGASAAWSQLDIRKIQSFAVQLSGAETLTCQIAAEYRSESPMTERDDRGFRVERVVRNLNDKERTGNAQKPFHLGDQILITYRLVSPKLHHYVALDSELPGGLETVNPNIASIARTYSMPQEKDTAQLSLSFSELRDRTTCLYFDRVEPGVGSYSVLARATSAGVFHWPATQVTPMYDSRFTGLSPSSLCYVVAE